MLWGPAPSLVYHCRYSPNETLPSPSCAESAGRLRPWSEADAQAEGRVVV